jgi:hypothetical protein
VEVDPELLKIGMSVQVVFRRIGDAGRTGVLRYAYKFRPLPEYATGHIIASVDGEDGVVHLEVPMEERKRRSVRRVLAETYERGKRRIRREKKKNETKEATDKPKKPKTRKAK